MPSRLSKTRNYGLLSAISLLPLTACNHVPCVPTPEAKRPELTVRVPQGPDYASRTQSFLQGKLPEQTTTEPASPPATK